MGQLVSRNERPNEQASRAVFGWDYMIEERANRWIPGMGRKRDTYPPAQSDFKQKIPMGDLSYWLLDVGNKSRLEDHLDWYLRTDNNYGGRQFEWFVNQSGKKQFDPFHILAAESLSIRVPPKAVRWLLELNRDRAALLNEIHESLRPGADTLWTCDRSLLVGDEKDLTSSGALYRLYYDLRRGGIGPVTTSKLLAAMFPAVVPIRDSMVSALHGLKSSDDWWLLARGLFERAGKSLAVYLDGLAIPDDASPVTTLRRLDIILWMEANARQF